MRRGAVALCASKCSSVVLSHREISPSRARYRRNGRDTLKDYVVHAMRYTLDMDTRATRLRLHAGRLLSGV